MATETAGLPAGFFVEVQELITHRVRVPASSEQEALDKARWMAWEGMFLVCCKEVSTRIINFDNRDE
jgi:hypothetical protein